MAQGLEKRPQKARRQQLREEAVEQGQGQGQGQAQGQAQGLGLERCRRRRSAGVPGQAQTLLVEQQPMESSATSAERVGSYWKTKEDRQSVDERGKSPISPLSPTLATSSPSPFAAVTATSMTAVMSSTASEVQNWFESVVYNINGDDGDDVVANVDTMPEMMLGY
eukprot:jgi/Chlat1/8656/Chrsp87S08055